MPEWITGNIGNIIVSLVLIVIVSVAVYSVVRNRKRGRSCGACRNCSMYSSCSRKEKEDI